MAKWMVSAKRADFQSIAEKFNIDPVTARILRNRDLEEDEQIQKFLYADLTDMYDPFLLKDMEKGVSVIRQAILEQKKIRVIGDYDADGICSSYILHKGIGQLGGDVDVRIPHRIRDGYGLNESIIREAAEDGISLIVTCDNGIAAHEPIALANNLHMSVVVTDHHEVPFDIIGDEKVYLIPEGAVVIDPKQTDCSYPFDGICGAVVAYKVIQALFSNEPGQMIPDSLLEMAAFATVCDVMELRDENRIIVKYGLKSMRHTKNLGLRALMEVCQLIPNQLSAYHIGFVCGPCFNATGRLDTAMRALELLEETDYNKAVMIARELKELNDSRKEMTLLGTKEAETFLTEHKMQQDKVFVIYLPDCHESIAGIIAGRIKEEYHKPVFVLTRSEDGVKGSGRSIEAYHMYEKINECKELFTRFGGHKMAAGVSMPEENVDVFRTFLNAHCNLTEEDFEEKIRIDVPMPLAYVKRELVEQFAILEPFGVGNPKPVFAQKNLTCISMQRVGKNKNVGKYILKDQSENRFEVMCFSNPDGFEEYCREKDEIAITYYPSLNEYAGKVKVQIVMQSYQ